MTKNFHYKGQVFHFIVVLNAEVERRPDGKRLHRLNIIVEKNGANTTIHHVMIDDKQIHEGVVQAENFCIKYVDGDAPNATRIKFLELGFE